MPARPESVEKLNDPQVKIDFEALGRIARKYELDLIILHGSRAQGFARSDSDVDIAVRTRRRDYGKRSPKREADWFMRLMGEINGAIDCPEGSDVRVVNQSSGLFLMCVATYGIPLYQASPALFWEFNSYAARRFYDEELLRRKLREHQREQLGLTATRHH